MLLVQAKFQEGLVRAESFYSASIKKGSTDMVPVVRALCFLGRMRVAWGSRCCTVLVPEVAQIVGADEEHPVSSRRGRRNKFNRRRFHHGLIRCRHHVCYAVA